MSIRILLVDDNLDTIKTYTKSLLRKIKTKKDDLINIDFVDTVSAAIDKLNSQRFDILVVDLKILSSSGSEWGGLEVIDESIKLDQLRPIIAITGYGNVDLVKRTLTQGVFDFIEKSVTAVDELIQAVQRAIDSRYEKMVRSGNPFTPMSGMQPIVFGGRTKELEFFEQKLYRAINTGFCEHFLIIGEWGVGKSTLLREYKKISQSRGYITSVVTLEPLQPGTKTIEAARSLIEGIIRDLPYSVDRFKRVLNFFDTIGITVLGSGLQLKRNTLNQELSVQAFLHDALTKLWQDLEDKTEILVILIDELENFMEVPEILLTLKSTLSMDSLKKTKILFGVASTIQGWLSFTSIEKHHPLSRYFVSRVELKPLSEYELSATVRQLTANFGVSFTPEVIELIYQYTQGHPFEMQLLGYHLFNNQLSGVVDINVWDKSLQDTLIELGVVIFERLLNQASNEETEILQIISQSNEPLSEQEIQEFVQKSERGIFSKSAEQYIQELVEKKLIQKNGLRSYVISDPMLRAYIKTYLGI